MPDITMTHAEAQANLADAKAALADARSEAATQKDAMEAQIRVRSLEERVRTAEQALAQAEAEAARLAAEAEARAKAIKHTVASGETLSHISLKYYKSANRWKEIYEANKEVIGDNPSRIKPGQVLVIPGTEQN